MCPLAWYASTKTRSSSAKLARLSSIACERLPVNTAYSTVVIASVLLVGLTGMTKPARADLDLGKTGEPVHLRVGYQPDYTQGWSAVVIVAQRLWVKYLPPGSTVEFQSAPNAGPIVAALSDDKLDIGYVGDMPAIASTFRYLPDRGAADIHIVATLGTSQQQCSVMLVSNQAPAFATGLDALRWLDGRVTAAPHGSCTDRFARTAFKKAAVTPKSYLDLTPAAIEAGFRNGKLDGAAIWEPEATRLEFTGAARRAASGNTIDSLDGGFLIMKADLIKKRPDVVRAWLEAELDAQLFLANPANATQVSLLAQSQTENIGRHVLWASLYASAPTVPDGGETRLTFDFILSDRVRKILSDATVMMNGLPNKPAAESKTRPEALDDGLARAVLEARQLTSPVGIVTGRPLADFR